MRREGPQRRRENRLPVAGIRGTLSAPQDLVVLNLSRHGLSFETENDVAEGGDYGIELRYRGRVVNLVANLRWCDRRPSETPDEAPVVRAGGRIVDVVAEEGGLWGGLAADDRRETPGPDEGGEPDGG